MTEANKLGNILGPVNNNMGHLLYVVLAITGGALAIGNVTATNYVYLNPVFTLIAAVLILGERMTLVSGLGSAMILGGVILAGAKKRTEQTK